MKKILPCVVGLGYVGLPVFLRLKKKFTVKGYDINKKRILNLKKKIDTNNEFKSIDLNSKKPSVYTFNLKSLKNCNFYIVAVPTPLLKNFKPDLKYLKLACEQIGKLIKSDDIVFFESTVFPGVTENFCQKILEKESKLSGNKDFYIGYSSERINPGDKIHNINNISKVVSINTNNKIKKIVNKVYKTISKKVFFTKKIKEAELSKLIENTQRDLNISLMNEIMILCQKSNLNYFEVIRLAKTKWNFLNFLPGLVGGHCLPVDPYYLAFFANKYKFKTNVTLAGRKINNNMETFVFNEITKKLKKEKIKAENKFLLAGLAYKKDVSDFRNSLAINIYKKLKKKNKNIFGYDPIISSELLKKLKIKKYLKNIDEYDGIIFLQNHSIFKNLYNKFKSKNKIIIDIFSYYS